MRFRLALCMGALISVLGAGVAQAAVNNQYTDGQDAAVSGAAPGNFRLNVNRLEPNCYQAFALPGVDIGDVNTSLDVINGNNTWSIDQMLVPGQNTGYRVVNTFDTGTVNSDPDIDFGQVSVNIDGPMRRVALTNTLALDNVAGALVIVCVSDHDDAGQNEPYAANTAGDNGSRDANEVYAKNRPVIQPTVASLGQGAFQGVKGYKLGLGYSVAKWYTTANANAGGETPLLRLTDPMGFSLDKLVTTPVLGGTTTAVAIDTAAGHVSIPPRIAGPRFNAVTDGPGVLRVNDVDFATESFGSPHFEDSDYGQTTTFNVRGDAQSFCLGGNSCAGIAAFGAQGDLPFSWSVKASLASVDSMRSVSFTPAQFDAWEQAWQNYYMGRGAKPTLPLTPGTNSPDPRPGISIVNAPEIRVGSAPAVAVSNTVGKCTGHRLVRFKFNKKASAGKIRYNGSTVHAAMRDGRLRATANLRGIVANPGAKTRIVKSTKINGKWRSTANRYKICG